MMIHSGFLLIIYLSNSVNSNHIIKSTYFNKDIKKLSKIIMKLTFRIFSRVK